MALDSSNTGSTVGSLGGAAIGGAVGGPMGAMVGMGLGGMAGSLFDKPKQYGFTPGDLESFYARREGEINDFQSQLAAMRAQYMAQIPQLQQAAFNRFMPDIESNLAGRGIDVNSGAFNTALARQAAEMQGGLMNTAYTSGLEGANAVNSARGGAYSGLMGGAGNNVSAPTFNATGAAMGRLTGSLASYAMWSKMNPSTGSAGMGTGGSTMTSPALSWNGLYNAGESTAAQGTALAGKSMFTGEGF